MLSLQTPILHYRQCSRRELGWLYPLLTRVDREVRRHFLYVCCSHRFPICINWILHFNYVQHVFCQHVCMLYGIQARVAKDAVAWYASGRGNGTRGVGGEDLGGGMRHRAASVSSHLRLAKAKLDGARTQHRRWSYEQQPAPLPG